MSKFLMIELMLVEGRISMDRAVYLIGAHYDLVESEWLHTTDMVGAFGPVTQTAVWRRV